MVQLHYDVISLKFNQPSPTSPSLAPEGSFSEQGNSRFPGFPGPFLALSSNSLRPWRREEEKSVKGGSVFFLGGGCFNVGIDADHHI